MLERRFRAFSPSPPQLFGWIRDKLKHHTAVFMLLALMAVQGVANLQAQWAIIGEFSNLPQEELLDWILENTEPSESHTHTHDNSDESALALNPRSLSCSMYPPSQLRSHFIAVTSQKYFQERSSRSV